MASSTFSYTFLSLILFVSISHFSSASAHHDQTKLQAEKLIRGFNLSPKHSINLPQIHTDDSLDDDLVEKPLKLNLLGDSGPSVQDFGHHAGYFKLPHTKAARMFYFFFESRNNKNSDPVVIWLTGGPGCSSELALFYENGPYQLSSNMSLQWNDYGWDKASNLIYVDQPTGTGFSYTTDQSDLRHDETGVSNDLYDFLQAFFKKHPELAKNDFYITGESYAGHYIPAFASRVHQGNKNKEGIHINFKGFAIGNGLTDPGIQYKAYTDYALENELIEQSDYERINGLVPSCDQAIKECGTKGEATCESAFSVCNSIFNEIMNVVGNLNVCKHFKSNYSLNNEKCGKFLPRPGTWCGPSWTWFRQEFLRKCCQAFMTIKNLFDLQYYDIRKKCEGSLCYDFSNMETFLNKKDVRDSLGVGNREFVSCSSEVYDAMIKDWMRNLEVGIPALLEDGIKVLIYAGEEDLICNWLGNSRWVHAMEWTGKKDFEAASTVPFKVEGAEAGQLKSHGPLTFLKVNEAGHMVPMDQPKAALQMLTGWMQGKLADTNNIERISPK